MRAGLVDAIVRGSAVPWASVAVLWTVILVVLLHERRGPPRAGRVLLLLGAGTATAIVGWIAASALSIPRLRWRADETSALITQGALFFGGSSWRSLNGPAVEVIADGAPDVAIPAVGRAGEWVLVGLLSGRPVEGLPPAPDKPAPEGAARICMVDGRTCRAWPEAWPAPSAASRNDLVWAKEPTGALAFDVETGRYLRGISSGEGEDALELLGDPASGAGRGAALESQVFVLRRVAGGRLSAVRVVSRKESGGSPPFVVHRIDASLRAGPVAMAALLPVLALGLAGLPLGALAYLLAPAWLAARLRQRGAVRRDLAAPLTLDPLLPGGPLAVPERGWARLAAVREDADLGDALLPAGTVVAVGSRAGEERPMTSGCWFELPPASHGDPGGHEAPLAGSAVRHEERGALRRVGVLVPADPAGFRAAARGWLSLGLHPVAVVLVGLAAAAPAVVGLAVLLSA